MLKTVLFIIILGGSLLLLAGCGPWGHWGGYGHGHYSSSYYHHDRDCRYPGY